MFSTRKSLDSWLEVAWSLSIYTNKMINRSRAPHHHIHDDLYNSYTVPSIHTALLRLFVAESLPQLLDIEAADLCLGHN
jgi:hypothetical protein